MMSLQIRNRFSSALLSLLLAAVFVLFFGECNTPLGARIGSDNAMYLTMGTALANGYAPYSDIFDHKGPLLFLLQMLPQMIAGGYSTLAVYVLEVFFLFVSLRILCTMANQLLIKENWLPQLIYLACLGPLMDGGNLTEEYAALFILAGLYTTLRVFNGQDEFSKTPNELLFPAIFLGGFTMLAFLTRANNALGLCGMTLGLALWMLVTKRPAHLGRCALGFIIGMAACALPVVCWLAAHGSLWDAFYGSILHNMMYAETEGASRMYTLLHQPYGHKAILLAALSSFGAVAAYIRTKRFALPLSMILATIMAGMSCFISHKFYTHYLMVLAPFAAFGASHILALLPKFCCCNRKKRMCAALGALMLVLLTAFGMKANANRLYELEIQGSFEQDAKELYAHVPQEERDSFMAYRVEPKWYVYAQALPCVRFYFLQEILADADPAVMEEIVAEFKQDPPKWLVIYYNRPFYPPYDARVEEIFNTQYEFVNAKGQYQLLRLIDDPF